MRIGAVVSTPVQVAPLQLFGYSLPHHLRRSAVRHVQEAEMTGRIPLLPTAAVYREIDPTTGLASHFLKPPG